MRVLLDESRVFLTYGSAFVFSGDGPYDLDYDVEEPWRDESNGLCGAGVAGILGLTTGTRTGWLPFRVELHAGAPPVDDTWEEIVEVSFTPLFDRVGLAGLDGDVLALELPRGRYRVRYCVRGMDGADTTEDPPDAYLLQFWPAPPAPSRILRQTSRLAAYWHRTRRTPGPHEQAEDASREALGG